MSAICFYLKAHQPYRIKKYRVFDIGADHYYFNGEEKFDPTTPDNLKVLSKVVTKSYLPTTSLLLELIKKFPDFKFSFSLTGTLILQLKEYFPEVLDNFKRLVNSGKAEILGETFFHSLAFFYDQVEFEEQVSLHRRVLAEEFGAHPVVFSNTELAYNNDLAIWADQHKYKGILAEGWDALLDWRSPNFVYRPTGTKKIKLLLKNYRLSDDLAFRFSEKSWREWPLSVEKYAQWINAVNGNGTNVNLFMDFETFGEHQWADTGIFDFLRALPKELLKHPDNTFMTPAEVVKTFDSVGELDCPQIVTWADTERDLSAWIGNDMQKEALQTIYELKDAVFNVADEKLIHDWRLMQTSDHFYFMCTKWFADGDVHKYFSPYESPYQAFIAYMNVIADLKLRLENLDRSDL